MATTMTEALAEIKTIGARLEKKRETVYGYLARQEGLRDPLERDGGSVKFIERERQAIRDLEDRIVALRRGIDHASEKTVIDINGKSRSIAEWITWRREVAPHYQSFLSQIRARIAGVREQAKRGGVNVMTASASVTHDNKPTDWIINLSEAELAKEIEQVEDTLGKLDGQLSLKNATVTVEV